MCLWSIRCAWLPQAEILFDICIVDTEFQSYLCYIPSSLVIQRWGRKISMQMLAQPVPTLYLCIFVDRFNFSWFGGN